MKSVKLILLTITIFGLFFSQAPQVFAGGGAAEGDPGCVVINPGSGALALKGTLSLVYDPYAFHVYVTLRLERSGNQAFFRLHLPELNLDGKSDQKILCYIFNPNETQTPEIVDRINIFANQILATFFPGKTTASTWLVITPSSATDYQNSNYCDPDVPNCAIGDSGLISTLGDVTVFAKDK